LQPRLDDFRALGCEVAAVSSSSVNDHRVMAAKLGIGFPVLADVEGEAIRAYGLLHPGALPFADFPVARPAVFIIDPQGVVRGRYLTANWRVRERPEHLLAELRALQERG
jgi:peroxiredoxin